MWTLFNHWLIIRTTVFAYSYLKVLEWSYKTCKKIQHQWMYVLIFKLIFTILLRNEEIVGKGESVCFTLIATIFQLYHGVSQVIYQYFWSIYPDTSLLSIMLTPQSWTPRKESHYYHFLCYDPVWESNPQPPAPMADAQPLYHWGSQKRRNCFPCSYNICVKMNLYTAIGKSVYSLICPRQ